MTKIIKSYTYNNEVYELIAESKSMKVFVNSESDIALITDQHNEVVFQIVADYNQGRGFLELVQSPI